MTDPCSDVAREAGGAPAVDGAMIDAVVAVDWSGALAGSERKIWLCQIEAGAVLRLENGRSREALVEDVIATARRVPRLVVGLDFAFSVPRWFFEARELASAHELWALAAREGEAWLRGPVAPFWGRHGTKRPVMPAEVRRTEIVAGVRAGRRPSSVFKLVGADQVGAGSVRGMAALERLSAAGFAVWPFDAVRPGRPIAVEIWPRLLYRAPVVKSSREGRERYLADHVGGISAAMRTAAAESDDAFDALTAALAMWEGRTGLGALGDGDREEGRIWGT